MQTLKKTHLPRRDINMKKVIIKKLVRKYCVVDVHGQTLQEFYDEADALAHVRWDLDQTISFKTVRE